MKPASPTTSGNCPRIPPPELILRGFSPYNETERDGSRLACLRNRVLALPWEMQSRHTLVAGGTGSGKTQRWILPSVLSHLRHPEMTVVLVDPQRAEEERAIRYARQVRGKETRIIRINFMDPERTTHFWNALAGIERASEAKALAEALASGLPPGRGDSRHFDREATRILVQLILAVKRQQGASLATVWKVANGGASAVRKLAEAERNDLLKEFGEMLSQNNNTQTTFATLLNFVEALDDERVRRVLSAAELDFRQLAKEPCLLILSGRESEMQRLGSLLTLFLSELFRFLIDEGDRHGGVMPRPVAIVIDEFASALGRIEGFERAANTLRKRNVAITAAVQGEQQIHHLYGSAGSSVLMAFGNRVYIGRQNQEDAAAASARRRAGRSGHDLHQRHGRRPLDAAGLCAALECERFHVGPGLGQAGAARGADAR